MAMLCGVVGSLSAFYHDSVDIHDYRHREISAHRLIAKLPTIAAAAYKHNVGEPIMYPRNDLRYCANFMHMMFATPCEDYKPGRIAEKALNCCSSCTRPRAERQHLHGALAGSSGANPFACIAAGIASLWGRPMGGERGGARHAPADR